MPQQLTKIIRDIERELNSVKDEVKDLEYKILTLQNRAKDLEKALEHIDANLVPKVKYELVEKIVFGGIGIIIIAVFMALVGMVVSR